jgi:glycerol uptake facilitator-like aquaporin
MPIGDRHRQDHAKAAMTNSRRRDPFDHTCQPNQAGLGSPYEDHRRHIPCTWLLTKFVATFIFLSTIALSGAADPLAPIAIGSALMLIVYMGVHISGGHYLIHDRGRV